MATQIIKQFSLFFLIVTMITSCNSNKNKKISKPLEQKIAILEFKTNSLLGEGAFWDFKNQKLYWVDIEGKKLHIYNPDSKMNQILSTPTRIGTVVPIDNKEAIIALEDGVYKIDTYTSDIELLSDVESKQVENRFNDGKCDPAGRFWVGTMGNVILMVIFGLVRCI